MKGDIETVKVEGKWINQVQGRYWTRDKAVIVRNETLDQEILGRGPRILETVRIKGRWANRFTAQFDTQLEASNAGMAIARILKVEWFQKSKLGRIRERNTYGHDPRNIKG